MISVLLDGGLIIPVKNNDLKDRLLILGKNPNISMLNIIAANNQSVPLVQIYNASRLPLFSFDKLGRPSTANTIPTIVAGAGAGSSPTISISGTDVNGIISLTSGTLPTGSAIVATITYSVAFTTTPKTVLLTPANVGAAGLNALTMVWVDSAGLTTAVWTINSGATGLSAATAYKWYYQVLG